MAENLIPTSSIEKLITHWLDWVQQQKQAVANPENSKTVAKPWSWFIGLVITTVITIGLAVFSAIMWKKGRQIAQLKHEKDVYREELREKAFDKTYNTLNDRKDALREEVKRIENVVALIDGDIDILEAKRKDLHEKIDAITSWDDLENTIRFFGEK